MATLEIDGTAVTNPGGPGASTGSAGIQLGIYRISNSSRAADGTMAFELIAKKRQVTLLWDKLSETDLKQLLDLLDASVYHTLTYPDPQGTNGAKTITCYVGDITASPWYKDATGLRWWDTVSVALIEK